VRRALEQSLLVLLRNAFDASGGRGEVVLEVTREPGFVRFEVKDQGSGMSPEMVRRARDVGRAVVAWTVSTATEAAEMRTAGVDAVICDDPAAVLRELDRLKQ